jgi:hypothetical protein
MRFAKPSFRARRGPDVDPLAASPPGAARRDGAPERSGKHWTLRFPTSRRVEDLASPFRERVEAFVGALRRAGAEVRISATQRPPERSYLMHWAWRIAEDGYPAEKVPAMPGVGIVWHHGSAASSAAAARAMVTTYSLVRLAELESSHSRGEAIDMTILWRGRLRIDEPGGTTRIIATRPRDGTNPELIEVGRRYGLYKLAGDPPHWSVDGT